MPHFIHSDLIVQFNPASYSVLESSGNAVLTLETDKPFEYPFSVEVNTADGTAVGEPLTMSTCTGVAWSLRWQNYFSV